MTMQTDVKASTVSASSTNTIVNAARSRLKAVTVIFAATGGTVSITDAAGGATLFSFPAPTAIGTVHILIPGEGILAQTSLAVTTGAGASAIVYYG